MIRSLVAGLMLATIATAGDAQRYRAAPQGDPPNPNLPYDGRFTFARLKYMLTSPDGYYYRGLPSWAHGYNTAEINLLKITHEVSLLDAHRDGSNVIAIDDPALFKYPVAYMTEAGYWLMSDKEVPALRKYLLRGGFLILDDTRDGFSPGNMGMANIEANFRRMFPTLHFVDISIAHPIFHSFFDISSLSIVPQYYDRGNARFLGLFVDNDPNKRLLALLNFNTDVSNFWEFSATGFQPIAGSNEAYKLGVNYLIYALTH